MRRWKGMLAFLLVTGCGYQWGTSRAGPLGGAEGAIGVPVFVNETSEPLPGHECASALREELADRGLRPAGGGEVLIEGKVERLVTSPSAFLPGAADRTPIGQYQAFLQVRVTVRRGGTDRFSRLFSGEEPYLTGPTIPDIESARRLAIRRLSRRLMRDAAHWLITGE
ncbi:MAG: hypothetical protein GMKNLPBB_00024 [Myxococcota bacterium]|nr:hypothetical protein [Myxococcota bacterium]